jgi:hypothetical protein
MNRQRNLKAIKAASALALVTLLALGANCNKGPDDGLTPYQRAEKQLVASLLVPPGVTYRNAEVYGPMDMVIMTFESMESTDAIAAFYSKAVEEKRYQLIQESTAGISFIDENNRQLGIMYFPRDAEIFKINAVIKISVQPLPADMKPPAEEPK